MRLSGVRFTVRRLIIGVALAAVMMLLGRALLFWLENRPLYLRQVAFHQRRENSARDLAASLEKRAKEQREEAAWERRKGLHDSASDRDRFGDREHAWSVYAAEQAEREATLRRKWEWAASIPWPVPDADRPYARHQWIGDNLALPDPDRLPKRTGWQP
jgi:hypothetical protein